MQLFRRAVIAAAMLALVFCLASCGAEEVAVEAAESSEEFSAETAAQLEETNGDETDADFSAETQEEDQKEIASESIKPASEINFPAGYHVYNGTLYEGDAAVSLDLTSLDLSSTAFGDYAFLSDFIQLERLTLDYTDISDLSPLAGLNELRSLNLVDCANITDLTPLAELENLEKINITLSTNISSLVGLPSGLKELRCSGLAITSLSGLEKMADLTFLNLQNCLDIEDFSALAQLTALEKLYLSETPFSDLQLLSDMSNLYELDVGSCLITDLITDYSPLWQSSFSLRELSCHAEGTQLEELKAQLPNCNVYGIE